MIVICCQPSAINVKKLNLKYIRVLMTASYILLIALTGLWLHSQLKSEKESLTKDLVKLFTNVQEQITDSLMVVKYVYPAMNQQAVATTQPAEVPQPVAINMPKPEMLRAMRFLLKNTTPISKAEEKQLFRMDTIVFNEIFTARMKENGWHFKSAWIPLKEKEAEKTKNIFIPSHFFTNENGVIISNYDRYLYRRLLPEFAFVLVLLSITATAFLVMYRGLKQQMQLSVMKDDFVSNMSHELKTPIATVKVALEALQHFDVIEQPELSRDYLGMAMHEMERLELLAGKALHTSLLESGKLVLHPECHDLEKLVAQVVHAYQLKLQQYGATISVNTIGENFITKIDLLHTQGILVNLLDNSLKYGVAPVRIRIILRESENGIQLSVNDNGPGIPEEYRERVFEKFFRVPTGNQHNTKGHGLGLNYAAQVMAQQNGGIRVENATEGGCTFTLTF